MPIELDHGELRATIHALAALRRARALAGQPVPHSVISALQHLETVHRCAVSPRRQENGAALGESGAWIGTVLAAKILGWHPRKVQRHAADLDGVLVGGRLVFPARTVRYYAKQIGVQHD